MADGGDLLPMSELEHQQRGFAFDRKNLEPAISLLRQRMLTGEPCPHPFINEVDPYSAVPEDLVRNLRHPPGKAGAWYLISPANYRRSAHGHGGSKRRGGSESTPNRRRDVYGGNGEVCGSWHSDKIKQDVRDADRRIVGYTRTLYYKRKKEATTSGWCMNEVWLQQQDGADQEVVLCKVYKLNSKRYRQSSTAASSEAAPVDQIRPVSDDDQMSSRVAGAEAMVEKAREGGETPVAVLPSMRNTATNLLLAAEKAMSCDFQKACEIGEFVFVKELHLTTIDVLGLDRSILSGSVQQLELRLRHIAMDKELTPTARDRIVSCGESMSQIILSAYLNEVEKRARQAFNALQKIGVNIHDHQVSKRACKVTNVSKVEGEENECPVQVTSSSSGVNRKADLEDGFVSKVEGSDDECPAPVISSAAASRSGIKRKADDDHPEAPASARQERADTDPIGPEEIDRTPFSQKYPMPVGHSNGGALGASSFEVQPEQHGVAEAAEGVSGPGDTHALKDIERNLFSEDYDYPMQPGGDNGGDWGWWSAVREGNDNLNPVGVGEPALRESAPGAVTEVDAGQGPDGPEATEHHLPPANDLTAVGGDNIGDPCEIFSRIMNEDDPIDPVRGDDGRDSTWFLTGMPLGLVPDGADDAGGHAMPPADTVLEGNDYPRQFDVEGYTQKPIIVVDSYLVSPSEDKPEQLAKGEISVEELLDEISPDELLGLSQGDMSGARDGVELV